MGLQFALAIGLISLSVLAILVQMTKRPPGWHGLIAANLIVVVVGALAMEWIPQWSGLAAAGVYVTLVLAPQLLINAAYAQSVRGHMRAARRYERLACLLHPTPRLRFQAAVNAATAHQSIEQKVAALRALARRVSLQQQAAVNTNIAVVEGHWDDVLECVRGVDARLWMDFKVWEIRALGELGRLDEMVQAFPTEKIGSILHNNYFIQLSVLAFTGRLAGVRLLLEREPLLHSRDYWLAIAAAASRSGEDEPHRLMARFAGATQNETFRRAAERHLAAMPGLAGPALSAGSTAVLDAIEQKLSLHKSRRATPVTLVLALLVIVGFVEEVSRGGSGSPATLIELGALSAAMVMHGEWWRLVASWFLHNGQLHFWLMLWLLLLLGSVCEVKIGSRRMFATYCLGGLASSMTALLMMWNGSPVDYFVGSSGGALALFGSEVGGLLRDRSYWRIPLGRHGRVTFQRYLLMQTSAMLLLTIDVALERHAQPLGFTVYVPSLVAGIVLNLVSGGPPWSAAVVETDLPSVFE